LIDTRLARGRLRSRVVTVERDDPPTQAQVPGENS
jgi:hypothetical protein